MSKLLSRFLPDERNRKLFPFFVLWLIGLSGGGLVFGGLELSSPVLGRIGVVVGFCAALAFIALVTWQLIKGYPNKVKKTRKNNVDKGHNFSSEGTINNTPARAEFWKDFICTRCQFPAPEKLRAQLASAQLSDFCNCGCNSFKVHVPSEAGIPSIAQPGRYSMVFEANFRLKEEGRTLEVLLFAGKEGNLAYVEIDCCGNSFPIPDVLDISDQPFHVHASDRLVL